MADEAQTTELTVDSAAAAFGKMREAATNEAPANTNIEGNDVEDKPRPDTAAQAATEREEMPEAQEDEPDATPDGPDDTGDTPTIAPPSGWTAEDQEWFKSLEPARQEVILRREKQHQAAESRRQNEHNEALTKANAKAEERSRALQYAESVIQNYRHPLEQAYRRDFGDVLSGQMDLFRLAQDQRRWPAYQAYQTQFQQLAQHEHAVKQQREADESERLADFVEARNNRILEERPEFKDPAKFEAFDTEVTKYLLDLQTPVERIRQISYEELMVVEKAMKWDKAQAAKANAPKTPPQQQKPGPGQTMVQSHVRQVPRVLKPGSGGNGSGTDDRFADAQSQLRKTGSTDDAATALAQLRARMTRKSA